MGPAAAKEVEAMSARHNWIGGMVVVLATAIPIPVSAELAGGGVIQSSQYRFGGEEKDGEVDHDLLMKDLASRAPTPG